MAVKVIVDTNLIINEIMRLKKISSDAEFARRVGISAQNMSNWRTRNTYDIGRLLTAFPDLSPQWLVTGEGNMYADPSNVSAVAVDHSTAVAGKGNSVGTPRAGRSVAQLKTLNEELNEKIKRLEAYIEKERELIADQQATIAKLVEKLAKME